MKQILKTVYKLLNIAYRFFNKVFIVPGIKASFGECGRNVRISYDFDMRGEENIYVGDNTQIGPHSLFWTTKARIIIGKKVLMGPHITIITGDHRTDIIGKYIADISENEKLPKCDEDVVIEDGVWLGANVTILKGVHVGKESIIAANSVLTKDVEAYSVYAGIPAKKIKNRFTIEELEKHKILLNK